MAIQKTKPAKKKANMMIRTEDYDEFQQIIVQKDLKVSQLFHDMLDAYKSQSIEKVTA